MPYKDPERAKAFYKVYRKKRYHTDLELSRKKGRANNKKFREKHNGLKTAWVDWVKESMPCMDCGRKFPAVCMDFDHRPGVEKVNTVSILTCDYRVSIESVFEEIAKCDLVCACCHRIRTAKRQGKEIRTLWTPPS